jgi:hypothetical protein
MPESLERASGKQAPELESHAEPGPRECRWTRAHAVWALSVASLIPGVIIAAFRNHWEDLPGVVQIGTYAFCAILIMVVVGLIMVPRDEGDD